MDEEKKAKIRKHLQDNPGDVFYIQNITEADFGCEEMPAGLPDQCCLILTDGSRIRNVNVAESQATAMGLRAHHYLSLEEASRLGLR